MHHLLRERIVVLDGAMGTLIQGRGLGEADFRGERFRDHPRDLRGANEVLNLTQPQVIRQIHDEYLAAGADIITTNTFNGTAISMAEYGLEPYVEEINRAAAQLARAAADEQTRRPRTGHASSPARWAPPARPPRSRQTSTTPARATSPGINWSTPTPPPRAVLINGGVDILLIETIFDTLNGKAAIFAVESLFEELGTRLPVIISGTITDQSGRTLSGQTVEAFWNSVRHARPFAVGLNCALGAQMLRPYVAELARIADVPVITYPNAGLPNAFGGYDEQPAETSAMLGEMAREGLLNLVGRCCGTTPDHTRAIAAAVEGLPPRTVPTSSQRPGWPAWNRSTSAPIRYSSTWASGPTSPARAPSRG